ncbi:hypothetical protein BGZ58_000178, partial [Dissophora ornata]
RGVDAFQIKPGPGLSYVLLMQPVGQYTLCPVNGELKEQFQGLARLLQIRNTIELYNSLISPSPSDASTTAESESDDNNLDWTMASLSRVSTLTKWSLHHPLAQRTSLTLTTSHRMRMTHARFEAD